MQEQRTGDAWPTEAFGLAGGCAAVVLAALVTAAFVAPDHIVVRAAVMALGVGVLAAVLTDWRACVGAAVLAGLIYIGFLVHRDGVLTGDPSAWRYTPVMGAAVLVGRIGRRLHRSAEILAEEVPAVSS